MSESEIRITELSSKVAALEVEASDLVARNSLLQKVATLQGAQPTAPSKAAIYAQVRGRYACCTPLQS